MGSYAPLSIGGYELLQTKSYVDPVAMSVFTERDRVSVLVRRGERPDERAEPIPAEWTDSNLVDLPDETTIYIAYRATSREVAERLEATGVSLADVRAAFERRLHEDADDIAEAMQEGSIPRSALSQMLREATFLDWSSAFQELMADDIHPAWPFTPPEALRTEMMRFIATESENDSFFGLPGDARWLLRAATEVSGPDVVVGYDISELVRSGWYELHQPVAEGTIAGLRRNARHDAPTIVLTEGSTDAAALEAAVGLLSPHLIGYLTFLDFHGANAAGGTGALVATVRGFAAAGVLNRAVALFDNDTAGRSAIRALERTELPESIRVAMLPDIALGRRYPTIGPTGAAVQDVNGRAGSLELYFGEDVLRGRTGDLTPVEWRGYDSGIGDWQGELIDKSALQQRFAAKIRRASEDPALLESLDWTGIRQIIDRVLYAFAEPRESRAMEVESSLGDPSQHDKSLS